MNNQRTKALEMYLDSSKYLEKMDEKFQSIGLNILEGYSGQSETVADDFCAAKDVIRNYIMEMFPLTDSFERETLYFDIPEQYIRGETDDRELIVEKMEMFWKKHRS